MHIVTNQQHSANNVAPTSQKIQHCRVSLEAAKPHYDAGLLTTTRLSYYESAIDRSLFQNSDLASSKAKVSN